VKNRPILRLKKPDHKLTPPVDLGAGFSYLDTFPAIRDGLPLEIGVLDQLMAQRPDNLSKRTIRRVVSCHCKRPRYLKAVAKGGERYNLQGKPVDDVAPKHKRFSKKILCKLGGEE
jgi:sRNA-binding protein